MGVGCVIVGAGIIGSAIAYELSRKGVSDILVLDPDLGGELSSTERNAGGVRHLWEHPVNIDLSRTSIAFFEKVRDQIGFQQKGYLWLFKKEEIQKAQALVKTTGARGLSYECLSVPTVRERYPFLDKTDDLGCALFGPKDGILNSNALKLLYQQHAKEKGVRFEDRCALHSFEENSSGVKVSFHRLTSQKEGQAFLRGDYKNQSAAETVHASTLILCAGAWTYPLLSHLAPQPRIAPIRRQICFFRAEDLDLSPYGMIVDTSRVYFHAEGGNILAGFVVPSEPEGIRFDYDADFFETYIWPALYERSTYFERLKHLSGWGGLYSYTPDKSGILGFLPGSRHIIEAHSFTGRGVMQSYGVAVGVTELLLHGKFLSFDASALNRDRFRTGTLLAETLHI